MSKKLLFILNPYSGKGLVKGFLADIIDIMVKADYEVTVYTTQSRGDAIDKTRIEAQNYDRIVCSGGDGTLDEVVTGMMQSDIKVPIGYIPAGSTNDFGSSLGIDKDMIRAAKISVSPDLFACDIGRFNQNSFVYVAAFGIFTEVSYQTSQDMKNALGHFAYILEGARQLTDIQSYRMQVEFDGNVIYDDFILGMITNSKQVGGFKGIIPGEIELGDGLFEVTLIRNPKNPFELNEILAYLSKLIPDTDSVISIQTSRIKFTSAKAVPWTLDGEDGGSHLQVTIENEQKALEIVVPSES